MVDAANVLPPATEADLTAKLEALQRDTHRQMVVVTIPDLQGYALEDYGIGLLRHWGVGLKGVDNGAILFIAPNEPRGHRGPRIEVGNGLEPVITDIFAGRIIREQMIPRLEAQDVPGAMTAGADALIEQLRASPDEAKARTDAAAAAFDRTHRRAPANGNGGGGLPVGLIFWGVVVLFIILPALGSGRRSRARRWGGGGSSLPIALWSIGNELSRSGRSSGGFGGWGGGGSSGGWGGGGSDGSWGGGGFTGGGGGSGGGGGASGSW